MKPKKLTDEQVQNTLTNAIEAAIDFIDSEIAPEQIKAQEYFDGKTRIKVEANRSKVVSTKCRDVVRAVKPGLMRMFLQSGNPVEFIPTSSQAQQSAEQATKYANYVFSKNGGFKILQGAIHDALIKKVGIVKVFYDETPETTIDNYSGLSEEAIRFLEADEETEVLEITADTDAEMGIGPDGVEMEVSPAVFSVKVARTASRGEIKMEGIAPEDFFVDRGAKSIDDCYIAGHKTKVRVGDLVAMGFDFEEVYELAGEREGDDEQQFARSGHTTDDTDDGKLDPSMREVEMTEAYMSMDIDGAGVPSLYKFICGGDEYKILKQELCDYNPFAVFEIDPEPHTFFGRSLVEIVHDDQDAATSLLRGLLDNIAMANNPGLAIDENLVNVKDVLNNEIGRVIRVKGTPAGAMQELTVGSLATTTLPALQYYDISIREKTGIVGAGMGLDVEALQSQTAAGVRMADQVTNAAAEYMARTLAEGGMTQMFKIIAQLARAFPNPQEMAVDGQFVEVDPRSWSVDLDMRVNVGLGTNRTEERIMGMQQLIGWQQGVWQAYGPNNGLVTMTGIRAAVADMAKLMGINGIDKYVNPMTPEQEAAIMQQQAQAAQGQQGSDPNAAFLQAEQMKASARVQTDMAKLQLDAQKAQMDDDRERDRMAQDLFIKTAEMGARPVNVQAIQTEQEKPRV